MTTLTAFTAAAATKFISDGTFGQRLFAFVASAYGIAVGHSISRGADPERTGVSTIIEFLRWLGFDTAANVIHEFLFIDAHGANIAISIATTLAIASLIGVLVAFRNSIYDVAPTPAFTLVASLGMLIDLDELTFPVALGAIALIAVVFGVIQRRLDAEPASNAATTAALIVASPFLAALYAPAVTISWFVQRKPAHMPTIRVENSVSALRVKHTQ